MSSSACSTTSLAQFPEYPPFTIALLTWRRCAPLSSNGKRTSKRKFYAAPHECALRHCHAGAPPLRSQLRAYLRTPLHFRNCSEQSGSTENGRSTSDTQRVPSIGT